MVTMTACALYWLCEIQDIIPIQPSTADTAFMNIIHMVHEAH